MQNEDEKREKKAIYVFYFFTRCGIKRGVFYSFNSIYWREKKERREMLKKVVSVLTICALVFTLFAGFGVSAKAAEGDTLIGD